ncbi:hypothetical protein BK127_28770 [Paenibacillus sp. FSL H7-0331]|nr:hypothetical protein BK127_28770 [Paenibacillus sp. FSL H7-0331]
MRRIKLLTMLVLMVFMALSMVVPAFAAGDVWVQKADIPTASGHLLGSGFDGKVYVMGGQFGTAPAITYSTLTYMFDPVLNTWASKKNMPYSASYTNALTVNGKIYVIGGQSGVNELGFSNRVQVYDPSTDNWTVKTNMPTGRHSLGLAEVGGKIYAIGGTTQYSTTGGIKVEVYDTSTDTWTTKTDLSTARYHFGTAVVNGKIYLIGGAKGPSASSTNEVIAYDPVTDTYSTKASLPINSLTYLTASATAMNGKIYVAGGASGTSTLYEYDPLLDTWTNKANMPEVKGFQATVSVNGKLYVISGYNGTGNTYSPTVYEYTPSLTVPVAPINLAATAGNAQVTLNWTTVDGATGYNIKRSTTAGGPYTTIASNVYGSPYTDTTVTNGTKYYYVVTALNSSGESGNSNEASATPQGTVTPPTGNRALLVITLVSGLEKEYDLSITEVNSFTTWYAARAAGTGPEVYTINKSFNKASFLTRKDNIAFNKIELYEVNEYTPAP